MNQYALAFPPAYSGREAWLRQLEVLRAAVNHLTVKEVCDVIDVNKTMISQALNEQHDKRWAAEWTQQIKAMLAQRYDDTSRKLLRALCDADLDLTTFVVDEQRELTAEEMALAFRAELARLDGGMAAIDRVLGRGKSRRR